MKHIVELNYILSYLVIIDWISMVVESLNGFDLPRKIWWPTWISAIAADIDGLMLKA